MEPGIAMGPDGRVPEGAGQVEEDLEPRPAARSALAEAIKARMTWLKPHVLVHNRRAAPLAGLEVVGA